MKRTRKNGCTYSRFTSLLLQVSDPPFLFLLRCPHSAIERAPEPNEPGQVFIDLQSNSRGGTTIVGSSARKASHGGEDHHPPLLDSVARVPHSSSAIVHSTRSRKDIGEASKRVSAGDEAELSSVASAYLTNGPSCTDQMTPPHSDSDSDCPEAPGQETLASRKDSSSSWRPARKHTSRREEERTGISVGTRAANNVPDAI